MSLILVLFALLITACSEDSPVQTEELFTGITETTFVGPTPIGNIDPNDWYYDKDSLGSTGIALPTKFEVYPAYPNPAMRLSKLRMAIPEADSVIIWVDDPMAGGKHEMFAVSVNPGMYDFHLDLFYGDDNFNRELGIVRVYIDFINAEDIPLIHGDIQIIE